MLAKMSEILIYVSLKQTKDKNIPQIRVTSYAFIDVNNKIGLHTEKQRQIILINVIENRYFQSVNVIKLGPFNTTVIYLLTTIL